MLSLLYLIWTREYSCEYSNLNIPILKTINLNKLGIIFFGSKVNSSWAKHIEKTEKKIKTNKHCIFSS